MAVVFSAKQSPCGETSPEEIAMKRIVLAVLALGSLGIAAQSYHRHFHIHQTSLTSFVVTCDNGADPTLQGNSVEKNAIEISCGEAKK